MCFCSLSAAIILQYKNRPRQWESLRILATLSSEISVSVWTISAQCKILKQGRILFRSTKINKFRPLEIIFLEYLISFDYCRISSPEHHARPLMLSHASEESSRAEFLPVTSLVLAYERSSLVGKKKVQGLMLKLHRKRYQSIAFVSNEEKMLSSGTEASIRLARRIVA